MKPTLFAVAVLSVVGASSMAVAAPTVGADAASTARAEALVARLSSRIAQEKTLTFGAKVTVGQPGARDVYDVSGAVERPDLENLTVLQAGKPVLIMASDGEQFTAFAPDKGQYLRAAVGQPSMQALQPFAQSVSGPNTIMAALEPAEQFRSPNLTVAGSAARLREMGIAMVTRATMTRSRWYGRAVDVVHEVDTLTSKSRGMSYATAFNVVFAPATWSLIRTDVSIGRDAAHLTPMSSIVYSRYTLGAPVAPSRFAYTPPVTATAYTPPPATADTVLQPGAEAPDFTVQTASGTPVKLSDYRGKVVVVDLWATWCGPCQESLPHTAKVAQMDSPKGVVFLPICVADTRANFDKWLPSHQNLDMDFLFDPAGRTNPSFSDTEYHADEIPTQFVIGRDGKIVATFVGYDAQSDPAETALQKAIAKALAAPGDASSGAPAAAASAGPAPQKQPSPASPAADDIGTALPPGTAAPQFTAYTPAGAPVKLSDYRGRVVVVDFWATWCPPCQLSLPHTARIAAAYEPKGVVFMPVCSWDTKTNLTTWLPEHKDLDMPFLYDPAGRAPDNIAASLYHVPGIPTQFVIGRNGKIAATIVGYDLQGDPDETQLSKAIDAALAGPA